MSWIIRRDAAYYAPVISGSWTLDLHWARRYWDRESACAKALALGLTVASVIAIP